MFFLPMEKHGAAVLKIKSFMKKLSVILACTLVMMAGCKPKDNPIKLNQVGFYPQAEKTASIEDDARTNEAALLTIAGKGVWEGTAV